MKILVYGAGPLGSFFAAGLFNAGHDVSILARGKRLEDIRQHGIVLEHFMTHERTVSQVPIVESLDANDGYDLVVVIMRKNRALEILPILAAKKNVPNILFMMNNAAGPETFVQAVGKERVLFGFPSTGGMFVEGHVIRHLGGGDEKHKWSIPIGEVDGVITNRTRQVADVLNSMVGFQVEIRTDMDAWLKTHVAMLFPSIAPAIYGAGLDQYRLARTRDLLVLMIRAMREAFRVLRALHIPVVPKGVQIVAYVPEALLVPILRKRLHNPAVEVGLTGHANSARDEVRHLLGEFMALKAKTTVPTPAIDRLMPFIDPATPLMPDGSHNIPMKWW